MYYDHALNNLRYSRYSEYIIGEKQTTTNNDNNHRNIDVG
jgi:hypothetical protein